MPRNLILVARLSSRVYTDLSNCLLLRRIVENLSSQSAGLARLLLSFLFCLSLSLAYRESLREGANAIFFICLDKQRKRSRNIDGTKVQYALTLTEFVSRCLPNASLRRRRKRSSSHGGFNVTLSYERDRTSHASSLFRFFSLYCLSFTMIFFLFNWLVLSPFSFFFSFFFYPAHLPLPEKKTRFSFVAFLLFHPPSSRTRVFRTHPFLSFLLSSIVSLFLSSFFIRSSSLPPRPVLPRCRSPFVRSAVQSCSKSRVCSCWSSSISPGFWILTFSPVGSRRTRKGNEVEDAEAEGRGQGKLRPVLPQR